MWIRRSIFDHFLLIMRQKWSWWDYSKIYHLNWNIKVRGSQLNVLLLNPYKVFRFNTHGKKNNWKRKVNEKERIRQNVRSSWTDSKVVEINETKLAANWNRTKTYSLVTADNYMLEGGWRSLYIFRHSIPFSVWLPTWL